MYSLGIDYFYYCKYYFRSLAYGIVIMIDIEEENQTSFAGTVSQLGMQRIFWNSITTGKKMRKYTQNLTEIFKFICLKFE